MKKSTTLILTIVVLVGAIIAFASNKEESLKETTNGQTANNAVAAVSDEGNRQIEGLEIPSYGKEDEIVAHFAYTLNYDEEHEQARWVAYMICRERAKGELKRSEDFRPDDDVPTGSAQPYDYKRSGYTRGHLAPAGDMKWNAQAMSECFLLSNMSPQLHDFNDGIWNKIESKVRYWAKKYDTLYVVTGPVLRKGLKKIGNSGISVPEYFYKVILDPKRGEGVGFVVPHKDFETSLSRLAVSIDSVERATGIDFYPALPDDIEEQIESRLNTQAWKWN